jgi:hypothetical protein
LRSRGAPHQRLPAMRQTDKKLRTVCFDETKRLIMMKLRLASTTALPARRAMLACSLGRIPKGRP